MNDLFKPSQALVDDLKHVSAIERRAEQWQESLGKASREESHSLAVADSADYLEVKSPDLREHAAAQIAENMRNNAEYARAIENGSPGISREIQDLDALNTAKMLAKEDFKVEDFQPTDPWPTLEEVSSTENERGAQAADAAPGFPPLDIDDAALERLARIRESDTASAKQAIGLNSIESDAQQEQRRPTESAQRGAPSGNVVQSDEVFTASQDLKTVVPADIESQYLRVGDKFYHPKNKDLVAFEDKGNKLETNSSSEAIAGSLVRIAEARGWDEIRVSGSEQFRQQAWLEAASRGMHVKGYTPTEQDKAALGQRLTASEANRVEAEKTPFRARESTHTEPPRSQSQAAARFAQNPADAVKTHPELAGAAAAVAAMEKKADLDGLTPEQKAVVMARVTQNVTNSIERGDLPEVKLKEGKPERETVKEFER